VLDQYTPQKMMIFFFIGVVFTGLAILAEMEASMDELDPDLFDALIAPLGLHTGELLFWGSFFAILGPLALWVTFTVFPAFLDLILKRHPERTGVPESETPKSSRKRRFSPRRMSAGDILWGSEEEE